MASRRKKISISQRLQTARVLWGALCGSVLVMGGSVLVMAVVSQLVPGPSPPPPLLVYLLAPVALVVAATSLMLPRMMYRQALMAEKLNVIEEVVPDPTALFRDAMKRRRVFDKPARARNRAATLFVSPFIVSMAMSEAVAIFGLVLSMVGHSLLLTAPFFVSGLVLALLRFPTEARINGPLMQAYDAVLPATDKPQP